MTTVPLRWSRGERSPDFLADLARRASRGYSRRSSTRATGLMGTAILLWRPFPALIPRTSQEYRAHNAILYSGDAACVSPKLLHPVATRIATSLRRPDGGPLAVLDVLRLILPLFQSDIVLNTAALHRRSAACLGGGGCPLCASVGTRGLMHASALRLTATA